MKFSVETNMYKNKIDKGIIEDFKNSLFDFINFNLKQKNTYDINNIEKSVIELFEEKKLSTTLNDFCKTRDMEIFIDKFQSIINKYFDINSNKFPINIVRISHPKIKVNKLNWHQDEATWNHLPECRKKFPFTFWAPLVSANFSSLAAETKPRNKIFYHSFSKFQGRFLGNYKSEKNNEVKIFNNAKEGDFVTFSSATYHKTWIDDQIISQSLDKEKNPLRISVDIRFVIPASKIINNSVKYSKRLAFLALKEKI